MFDSDVRYRQLIEASPIAMLVTNDLEGIVYANRAAARLYGAENADQLIGRSTIDLVHPEDRDSVRKRRIEVLQGDRPAINEDAEMRADGRRLRLDGTAFYSESRGIRLEWDGTPSLLLILQDVTERRQAEIDLREREEQLRAIIDNSPSIIYLRDTESNLLRINKTYEAFFGVTEGGALGQKNSKWLNETLSRRFAAAHRKVLESGKPVELDFEAVDAAGRRCDLRAVKFPVMNDEGDVVAVGGITTDVTAPRRARRELERQKAFFETLVDAIPARVTMKDADGRYIFVNRMLCEASGLPAEEIIGKTPEEAFGFAPGQPAQVASARALATGEPIIGIERRSEFRPENIISSSFVPVRGPEGTVDYVLGISFDVTENRQREAQLHRAQKMEAVGQLTGGVAHDFNNLLTVALGNLELLAERLDGDEISRGYVANAISGAHRGAELTHRLLAFSRRQTLAPASIDPRRLVDGLLDLVRRTLGETIDIDVTSPDDLWQCEIDPAQLESAILNLAINARDAMPDGGKLVVAIENVSLGGDETRTEEALAPGPYVSISVSDTGTGIPDDAIDHVFEPFFTTKDVGKGSGLGLSMVYGFVTQSGGRVVIDSEPGSGTTVRIYLPRAKAEAGPAAGDEDPMEPRGRGETILVVEDDADVRGMVVAQLAELGYAVVEAKDANSALAALDRTERVDLLFTDVVLPGGKSGPQLAREVTQRRPGLPVLFTSGYSDEAIFRTGRSEAANALLGKPFRKSELARRISAILDPADGRRNVATSAAAGPRSGETARAAVGPRRAAPGS